MIYRGGMAPESLTAAQIHGINNRVRVTPDLLRRIARVGGYDVPAPDNTIGSANLATAIDAGDLQELLLLAHLADYEDCPEGDRVREMLMARHVLTELLSDAALDRKAVHDALPAGHTTLLMRMGPPIATSPDLLDEIPAGVEKPTAYRWSAANWAGEFLTDESVVERDLAPEILEPPKIGYARTRQGISLVDGPDRVWSSARGYWTLQPGARYVVPSRYGWCPYVFRVDEDSWTPTQPDPGPRGKYYAARGWLVDAEEERLIEMGAEDPDNGWLPTMTVSDEPPTEDDMRIARLLSGRAIRLGPVTTNPVLRLRQKGKVLF